MNILIVSQHFWPESFRINEVAKSLQQLGCRVTVLTAQPNYPDGVVFAGYSPLSIRRETLDSGIKVFRVPIVPRRRGRALHLVANYCSFILSASVLGPVLLRGKHFDMIFVYGTSPILQAISAIVLKKVKRAPLVTWVQDLWPQSLEETGFVSNRAVLAMVERMVAWIYPRTDLLMTQSRAFMPFVRQLSGGTPVEYFPNPSETVLDADAGREPALVLEPGFNVVFAGNLGTLQALDTVLDAAQRLQSHRHIRFVLIGSGSRLEWLRQAIAARSLQNVSVPGRFAAADVPAILSQASVLLVTLIRRPAMSRTVPSKIQTYLAVGRPILAALDGEGAQVIRDAGAGVAVPAEDPEALANAVLRFCAMDASERLQMGEAGRRYHAQHFDSRVLAERLLERFRLLVHQRRGQPAGASRT